MPDQNLAGQTAKQLDAVGNAILYYGSLAPSGHNSQPWVVRVLSQNEWIIGVDPDRRLPAVDPGNREVMLSLGAFAENLSIAAGTFCAEDRLFEYLPGSGEPPATGELVCTTIRW